MQIVILAQGQQQRLPQLQIPKQWINLGDWAPQGEPILARTLRLVRELAPGARITVVAGERLRELVLPKPSRLEMHPDHHAYSTLDRELEVVTLANPGNCSVAGLRRLMHIVPALGHEETTVLLGDVVYSRATLRVLLDGWYEMRAVLFAGTKVVTASLGELWGLRWTESAGVYIQEMLERITDPPTDVYQAGQLRKLLWLYQRERGHHVVEAKVGATWYHATDDFTADIDTPADMAKLPVLALAAWQDDQPHRPDHTVLA